VITIDIQDLQEDISIDISILREYVVSALKVLGIEQAEISIVIVDDQYIKRLNTKYLGRNRPTNVLSFSQQEGPGPKGSHLGDIVISAQRAFDEAKQAGMTAMERIKELLIHGICHLAGYEHEGVSGDKALEMARLEEDILIRIDRGE